MLNEKRAKAQMLVIHYIMGASQRYLSSEELKKKIAKYFEIAKKIDRAADIENVACIANELPGI